MPPVCAVWSSLLVPAAYPPSRLAAQSLTLAGRAVIVRGADSLPARGIFVVAHAMSATRQGPVDSVRSDAAGRFRFRIAEPETATVYVVSARHAGIGYVSEPFGAGARPGADAIVLALFDTASAGPPLSISRRHIVITSPDSGGRRVLDIVIIHNPGTTTRVAADSTQPTWRMRLPDGALAATPGEGEVSPAALRVAGGELLLSAPLPPGDKQIAVTYLVADDEIELLVDQPTASFQILAEDSLLEPLRELRRDDPMMLEGRVFQRFGAEALAAGARPTIRARGAVREVRDYWWLPVGAVALLLIAGAVYAVRVAPR